jgi:sigma-E factor negative regulatory protein RseC
MRKIWQSGKSTAVNTLSDQSCPPEGETLETEAEILRVEGRWAIVRAARRSGCASCSVAAGCGSGALGRVFSDRDAIFRINNGFGGRPGERIVLGLAAPVLLKAALAVYFVPLVVMIAAGMLAGLAGWGDGPAAMAGLAGLAGSLAVVHVISRRKRAGMARPVYLRRA